MCFTADYDWYASIWEKTTETAESPFFCEECLETIAAGEKYVRVYAQQYEECHACYAGDCSCANDECCKCEEPTFGETMTYACCLDCEDFLGAVEAAEIAEGCHRSEARPPLGMMQEALRDAGEENCRRYFESARKLHPRLEADGWLARLHGRLFDSEGGRG